MFDFLDWGHLFLYLCGMLVLLLQASSDEMYSETSLFDVFLILFWPVTILVVSVLYFFDEFSGPDS